MNDVKQGGEGQDQFLFVYGTLKKDQIEKTGIILPQLEWVSKGWCYGTLFDTGKGYPALTISKETTKVEGELYRFYKQDAEIIFQTLDPYEDYYPEKPEQSEFLRTTIELVSDSGEKLIAWCYLYNQRQ